MFRLFSQIRGDLLSQSKMRKYLLYAVGEVLLITVGILIALQISNWNEKRQDRARERVHLEQLYADFATNADRLTRVANHRGELAENLMIAVSAVKRGELAADEVELFKWVILTMHQFPPSNATTGGYDAIIASGDFAIIQDQELKSNIVKIASAIESMQRQSEMASEEPLLGAVSSEPFRALTSITVSIRASQRCCDAITRFGNQAKLVGFSTRFVRLLVAESSHWAAKLVRGCF